MTGETDLFAAIKRRPVGKGAWRMAIAELIESERASLQSLRAIGNRHPHDMETQRLVSIAALDAGERILLLNELQHYRDDKTHETTGGNE